MRTITPQGEKLKIYRTWLPWKPKMLDKIPKDGDGAADERVAEAWRTDGTFGMYLQSFFELFPFVFYSALALAELILVSILVPIWAVLKFFLVLPYTINVESKHKRVFYKQRGFTSSKKLMIRLKEAYSSGEAKMP